MKSLSTPVLWQLSMVPRPEALLPVPVGVGSRERETPCARVSSPSVHGGGANLNVRRPWMRMVIHTGSATLCALKHIRRPDT